MQKQQCTMVLLLGATHDTSNEVSRGEEKADEHTAADEWKMAYTNSAEAALEASSAKANTATGCKPMPAEADGMVWSCLTLNFIRRSRTRKDLPGT